MDRLSESGGHSENSEKPLIEDGKHTPTAKPKISRRRLLGFFARAAPFVPPLFAAACAPDNRPPSPAKPAEPGAAAPPQPTVASTQEPFFYNIPDLNRNNSFILPEERTPEDSVRYELMEKYLPLAANIEPAVANTNPSLSLDLTVRRVKEIQAMKDPTIRFLRTMGYLSVQPLEAYTSPTTTSLQNKRYPTEGKELYTCNIYAQDFAQIMLGGGVISHWVDKLTGKPSTLTQAQMQKMKPAELNSFKASHSELDANSMVNWFDKYGNQYGWSEVSSSEDLEAKLAQGYLGFGVKKLDQLGLDGIGHNYILGWVRGKAALSQANFHKPIAFPDYYDKKLLHPTSPFRVFVHKIL